MAVTLSPDQQEITWFSFPITKMEATEDGDLRVFGKCTDGSVDRDLERIDVGWSQSALKSWLDTGGNVRLQHDPKRPVGKGLKLDFSPDGHYLTALVVDPLAKEFVRKGVLTAYSVGITRPDFTPDPTGKATRIITGRKDGQTEIAEVSLVDRPSNRNCGITLCKRAPDGTPEYVGKVFGDAGEIAKAASATAVKSAAPARSPFSPADLNKLLEHRRIAEQRQAEQAEAAKFAAEAAVYKRDVSTAERRTLRSQGRALDDLSYPIKTHEDAENALTLALSGHGNVAAAKKLIRRIATKEGWQDILDRLGGKKKENKGVETAPETEVLDKSTVAAAPETPAAPAVAKDDDGGSLHHDDGEDDDTDSDADANEKADRQNLTVKYESYAPEDAPKFLPDETTGAEKGAMPAGKPKVPCPKCKAMCKPKARFCGKCGCSMGTAEKSSKPTPDGGAVGSAAHDIQPVPEHREPDGPAIESLEHDASLPTVPDSSVKTAMHLSALGVPGELGMLHGLLCPAYDDASVKGAFPGADLSFIDEMAWQAKALETACGAPLEEAEKASQIWTTARILKAVTPDLYDDIMAETRKAFRDANPGPGTAPQPGEMSAARYNRPYITAGHSAPSPDHDGPNKAPIHPGHIAASDFTRDLITAGHAADSPENSTPRPAAIPAPEVPGVPSRVFYTNAMRQNARQAMQSMHDHIAMSYPDLCPMHGPGRMGEAPSHARPVPVGVGGPVPHGASKAAEPDEAVTGDIAAKAARKAVRKALRRQRDELLDGITKGLVSIDQARAALDMRPWNLPETGEGGAVKAATPTGPAPMAPAVAKTVDPDLIKSAVAEATAPLMAELAEQRRIIDAIADQPDPNVTAYRGAALNKTTSAAPAGPLGIQQRAALAQEHFITDRIDIARNSPDPGIRLQAMFDLMEVHGLTGGQRT